MFPFGNSNFLFHAVSCTNCLQQHVLQPNLNFYSKLPYIAQ